MKRFLIISVSLLALATLSSILMWGYIQKLVLDDNVAQESARNLVPQVTGQQQ